jgi:isocitrate dehydrogenase kinase/phosphatase
VNSPSGIHIEEQALQIILTGFNDFCEAFATITQRASRRFEQKDWHGMRRDTVERLDLYPKIVDETVGMLNRKLGKDRRQKNLWTTSKTIYHQVCKDRSDAEIAFTFYNSVIRKLFHSIDIEPELTFIEPPPLTACEPASELYFSIELKKITPQTIGEIFEKYQFRTPFVDLHEDARRCAIRIGQLVELPEGPKHTPSIDMLRAPFFRGMSAHLVGRLRWRNRVSPLVFVLDNDTLGLRVDALLTTQAQMRRLFSFSRAYFHVQTPSPGAIVAFLKQSMPEKRIAELYIGLGYHKHGKTELYRDLLHHQKVCSQDRFDFSPGKHGMVMITFNMPEDDLIYKLIRDRFDSPKQTTARKVMEKYDYVFKHDRAGRLLDVQLFENLKLEECCFTPALLEEISKEAKNAATVTNDDVILHHAYVERRVTPLDLFIKSAAPDDAKAVVIDYGQAIKDLANINVFPGDMLIKNFGVTRLGRVVFYDYDELCPLLECNFRKLPHARQYEDELSDEPWFTVGVHDVFPEEFSAFLGLPPHLRQVFLKYHGDLLEPDFWLQTQSQIRSGTWTHIRPYGTPPKLRP